MRPKRLHGGSRTKKLSGAFEKAMNEGFVGPCVVVVTGDSTAARIRLGSRDVAKTRVQAAKRSLRFHLYLKALIQDSLRNA